MDKSPEAFRTISEVSELLETPAHVLRFWETRFPQIRPVKRAGGRRYYRPGDVALLTGIKRLLHEDGMTIRGVQKLLREQGIRHVAGMNDDFSPEAEALQAAMANQMQGDGDDFTAEEAAAATAAALAAALAGLRPGATPDDNIIAFPSESPTGPARDASVKMPDLTEEDQAFFPGLAPTAEEEAALSVLEPLQEDDEDMADLPPEEEVPEAPFIAVTEEARQTAELATFARPSPLGRGPTAGTSAQDHPTLPASPESGATTAPKSPGDSGMREKNIPPSGDQIDSSEESTAGQTLAARIRALPKGALAAKTPEIQALLARFLALHAKMGRPQGKV